MAPSAQVEREIDGTLYIFSYLPVEKALTLSVTLAKALLAPAGSFIEGLLKGGSILDADTSQLNLGVSCEKLAANLDPKEWLAIQKELLTTVRLGSGPAAEANKGFDIDINSHFRGRIKHLYKVLFAALEVNYQDFFDDLAALAAKGKAAISTRVQTKSPGPSGDLS